MLIPDIESAPYRNKTSEIAAAFRTLGATSPDTALDRTALELVDAAALNRLIAQGIVRPAARGSLYLDEDQFTRSTGRRYVTIIAFWLLVLAIPIVILQWLSG